jgi:hypothetical protein
MKTCIAVLTRGYDNIDSYSTLIKRNLHIACNLNDKSIDILIYHEGNIREDHQIFIKSKTPRLKIQFIDISNIAFQPNKQNIIVTDAESFSLGYRHMCSFWFIDFFNAVKEYDTLLRIDEDCFVDSNIDTILLNLKQYTFITGIKSKDEEFVTRGLNQFSLNFVNRYNDIFSFKKNDPKRPEGPYTNLFGCSLEKIRNNDAFQKYKNELDESNMIYQRRWGDLPLWGEVIYYIFGEETMKVDNNIMYYHGSHFSKINYNSDNLTKLLFNRLKILLPNNINNINNIKNQNTKKISFKGGVSENKWKFDYSRI